MKILYKHSYVSGSSAKVTFHCPERGVCWFWVWMHCSSFIQMSEQNGRMVVQQVGNAFDSAVYGFIWTVEPLSAVFAKALALLITSHFSQCTGVTVTQLQELPTLSVAHSPRQSLSPYLCDTTCLDLSGTLKTFLLLDFLHVPHLPLFFLSLIYPSSFISLLSRCFLLDGAYFCWHASPGPPSDSSKEHWCWKSQAAPVVREAPAEGHGNGPLPSLLLFASSLIQIMKHLFLTSRWG